MQQPGDSTFYTAIFVNAEIDFVPYRDKQNCDYHQQNNSKYAQQYYSYYFKN